MIVLASDIATLLELRFLTPTPGAAEATRRLSRRVVCGKLRVFVMWPTPNNFHQLHHSLDFRDRLYLHNLQLNGQMTQTIVDS